jgi:nicotinamide-nucleotide amidase
LLLHGECEKFYQFAKFVSIGHKNMPAAEIISIGTELLLGEIVDTNAPTIARALRDIGVDLYRKTTIGDNANRIATAIQEGLNRADIILTTGGLGPTVDDPTRDAVALAVGRSTEYQPELWEQIQARFARYNRAPTENNKRQAYVPQGAIPVENRVGTAPAFIVEVGKKSIFSLPGVPREMEFLLKHAVIPYIQEHFKFTSIIKTRILHTAGVGESQIDDWIDDLERLSNPTVGLSAHSGQVDVRITVKADNEAMAEALIAPVEAELRQRLGDSVYGIDQDTLEGTALQTLQGKGWSLGVIEYGMGGELVSRFAKYGEPFKSGEILPALPDEALRLRATAEYGTRKNLDVTLGTFLIPGEERQDIYITLVSPEGSKEYYRPYGGPPGNAPRFAVNHSLELLRKL